MKNYFLIIILSLLFTNMLFSQDVLQDNTYIGIWTKNESEMRGDYFHENKIFIEIRENKTYKIMSLNKKEPIISGRNKKLISINFLIDEGNWFIKDSLLQLEIHHRIENTAEHIYFSNFPLMALVIQDSVVYLAESEYNYQSRMVFTQVEKGNKDLTPEKFFPENFGIIRKRNKSDEEDKSNL